MKQFHFLPFLSFFYPILFYPFFRFNISADICPSEKTFVIFLYILVISGKHVYIQVFDLNIHSLHLKRFAEYEM